MTHTILAARTDFSIGESILTVEELVNHAATLEAKAVGITDTMSVTAMIDLTNRCKQAGLKPVIGCRLRIVDDPSWRKPKATPGAPKVKNPPEYYMMWYVLSELGLRHLFRLLSLANSESHFYYNAKIGISDLLAALEDLTAADVAITTGDALSIIHHPNVESILRDVATAVPDALHFTLTPLHTPYWDTLNKKAIELQGALGGQFLVTRPALYLDGGADALDIMNAIAKNARVSDPWANFLANRDVHPLAAKAFMGEVAGAIRRLQARGVATAKEAFVAGVKATDALVDKVGFLWTKQPVSLPKMAPDEFAALVGFCKKGWARRFADPVFGYKPSPEELRDVYQPRLKYELGVLKSLGFAGYFLLVHDVVAHAKDSGILVGPGRGSVGGSLVAYLMGITDCDPLRFGLLFERFINPDRIDLPDADLDFMSERRHEVIEYLVRTYGEKRVAGISNFSTLGPASAIREVGRAFNLEEPEYRCSKLAPKKHGIPVPLIEAAEEVPEIAQFAKKHALLWENCLKLEGVTRNLAQHAAGVVVGGVDLVERAVVEKRGEQVVNWDKRIVEDQGLVKMDILGLSTLDLIALTLKYIRSRHSKKVDLLRIPLNDPKVLENFAKGLTIGVFQFESGGMRRLLKELGADGTITFDDITAATALYRPGPMDSGMMESYFMRKQGREPIEYDHPLMEPALKDTYGVMVYQEQVMRVARDIAGYSMADADVLRKIMGKKDPEKMAKERGKFVDGCVKTVSMHPDAAGELFDKIEKFAGYGFNKSHSVEYTLISYQSMWLKTYYPVEFFAAALSLMKDDKLSALLKDAERFGIEVLMPDVNLSTDKFEIYTDTKLVIPFNRVKGIAAKTTNAILTARAAGKFTDRADFEARVEKRSCNVRHKDTLDKVGAFASIEPGSLPARDPKRLPDQRELIPGLIVTNVPVGRELASDKYSKARIVEIMKDYRLKHGPEGDGDGWPVKIKFGSNARFMVISDAPSHEEEQLGMGWGTMFNYVNEALEANALHRNDGYWTALIKRCKEGKQVSPKEVETYLPYLQQEIEVLKPPVIVLLGSTTVRQFIPDFKGKASEAAGQVTYSKDLDANLIVGFSPGEIWHSPEKQEDMNAVFAAVASLLD